MPSSTHSPTALGIGKRARLLRDFDWSATALGPSETWPQSWKTATELMLRWPGPALLLLGRDGVVLHNDAFAAAAGENHTLPLGQAALGKDSRREFLSHVLETCFDGGSVSPCEAPTRGNGNAAPRGIWRELTYTGVPDETGAVQAVLGLAMPQGPSTVAEPRKRTPRLDTERETSAIFAHAAVGLSEISPEGEVIRVNDALCRMLGRSREELLGATVATVTHPDDLPHSIAVLQRVLTDGGVAGLDKRYLRPDGEIVWANSTLTRLEDAQGAPRSIIAVTVDLTSRKRREFNAQFLAEIQHDFARLTDAGEILRVVGDKLHRYLGLTRLAMLETDEAGSSVSAVFNSYPGDPPMAPSARRVSDFIDARLLAELRAGHIVAIEDVELDPRTAPFLAAHRRFEIRAQLLVPFLSAGRWRFTLFAQHREPHRWRDDEIEVMRDLTTQLFLRLERARAEAALRESEQRFRAIVSQTTLGLSCADLNGTIIFVNQRLAEMLERDPAELIGHHIRDITHSDDFPENKRLRERAFQTMQPFQFEKRMLRRDGSAIWVAVTVTPIRNEQGNVSSTVAAVLDISLRKRAEEALKENERQLAFNLDAMTRLQQLSFRLVQAGELLSPLREILAVAAELTGTTMGTIQIRDADSQRLKLGVHQGVSENFLRAFPNGDCLGASRTAVQERRRVIVEDITAMPRMKGGADVETALEAGIHSIQATPLVGHDGQLLGTLNTFFTRGARPAEQALRFIDLLARMAADVVERLQTEEQLRLYHDSLEERVLQRTAELDQLNSALRDEILERTRTEESRQALLRKLVNAQEEERRRISRELHDEAGQHLTALTLGLKSLQSSLPAGSAGMQTLKTLQGITQSLGKEIHDLALELRPTALDDLGLLRTVSNYLDEWSSRSGIEVDFHSSGMRDRLPSPIETTIFRIVREALNNVLKHASAKHVSLIIERRSDHAVTIIEDDGVGFRVDPVKSAEGAARLGLLGMRERAALVGGEVRIESGAKGGTTVFVRIPLGGSKGTTS